MSDSRPPDAPAADAGPASWRFGLFVLQPGHALLRGSRQVPLGRRALDLLGALVQAEGAVVHKDALLRAAWPGQVVVENALHQHVRALRRALGDQAALVETVPGRGYRLAAAVERCGPGHDASPAARPLRPPPPWPLHGRQTLLRQLAQELTPQRCVTLLGPSGIGKTRLAQELAQQREAAGQTVVWCDLGALLRGAELPDTIARAFGLPGQGGPDTLRRIALALRDAAALLVLDNCEHLHEDCAAAVQTLLDSSPALAVLATSQRPLGLVAELRRVVDALPLPADDAPILGQEAPALQLLLERVLAAGGAAPSDSERPLAAALCRRLDGVPLALELAAARVVALGWQATVDGLAQHFRLLVGGARVLRPQHRSLDAAIAWSCDLLPAPLQRAWAALSVFRGGWTLAAAQAVLDTPEAVALLAELVERSLVQRQPGAQGLRWCMHEAQRSHARARLARSNAAAGVLQRKVQHLARQTAQADAQWDQMPDAAWLAQHGADFDNLVDAVHGALARGERPMAARLLGAATGYGQGLGAWPTLRSLLEHPLLAADDEPAALGAQLQLVRARSMLGESSDNARLEVAAQEAVQQADAWLPPLARAQARLCLASAAARRGGHDLQASTLQAAEALLAPQATGKTWGWCRSAAGWALQLRGDLRGALVAVRQARAAWQASGAWLDEGRALVHIADLQLSLDEVDAALVTGTQAVARWRGPWHRGELGRALANLGAAHARAGNVEQAHNLLLQALQELQGLDFSYWVFDHLAALAAARGDGRLAARCLGHADAGYQRHRSGRRLHNEAQAQAHALAALQSCLGAAELASALRAGAAASEGEMLRELTGTAPP